MYNTIEKKGAKVQLFGTLQYIYILNEERVSVCADVYMYCYSAMNPTKVMQQYKLLLHWYRIKESFCHWFLQWKELYVIFSFSPNSLLFVLKWKRRLLYIVKWILLKCCRIIRSQTLLNFENNFHNTNNNHICDNERLSKSNHSTQQSITLFEVFLISINQTNVVYYVLCVVWCVVYNTLLKK
jgi:hypothetical protein